MIKFSSDLIKHFARGMVEEVSSEGERALRIQAARGMLMLAKSGRKAVFGLFAAVVLAVVTSFSALMVVASLIQASFTAPVPEPLFWQIIVFGIVAVVGIGIIFLVYAR